MSNISKIKISGTSYSIKDENACNVVELTQAEYDDLPTTAKTSNSLFVITDATAGDLSNYYTKTETDDLLDTKLDVTAYTPTDLSNYYTKSETSGATEISTALASKADTATTYTKTETDNAITAATSTKQDTLVSGTNIKTINNQSILGEGNIDIKGGGGGKAIEAGRGISITTGETADTVSLNEAISASTASSSTYIAIGSGAKAEAGYKAFLTNSGGIAIGSGATANRRAICIGNDAKGYNANHIGLISIGLSSVSKQGGISIGNYSDAYGEIGFDYYGGISIGFESKTQSRNAIAIGYKTVASGTTKTNINNQLTIDTSNQVYIYNKDNTEMICLQDQLGGGGSSYTAGDGIDITNDVISVTGKVDTSTYNTYTAATDTALASKQTTLTAGTGISIVDNVISATGGGGGMTEDDELLLSTALTDLNDRKIDASEVKANYQKKGEYATKDYVTTALEPYETKLDEINTEEVTAYALNDLNNKFGGLSLVKITESEYAALTTKNENTLYIVVADPS